MHSPSNVGMGSPSGPSKKTRQSTRKKVDEALDTYVLSPVDIIQSTTKLGKEVAKIIK